MTTPAQVWLTVLCVTSVLACSGSDEDEARKGGSSGSGGASGAASGTGGSAGKAASSGKGGTAGSSSAAGGSGGRAGRGGSSGASGSDGSGGSSGATGGTGASGADGGGGDAGTDGGGAGGAQSGAGGDSGTGGEAGSAGASPSDGCTSGTKPARGHYTITSGSQERGYFLVPSTAEGPVPLVFEFHGGGGNGEGILGSFDVETALGGAAVIIAPDGLNGGWATGGNGNEDVALVKALIEQAQADHCVDTTRIYALGFSWGGWMATQAACALGPGLRGFISVAGGGPMGGACNGAVGAMIVHGSADTAEPIAAGIGSRDRFRTENGCSETLVASDVAGCQEYTGCSEPLLWCEHAGDHFVPSFVIDGMAMFFDSL